MASSDIYVANTAAAVNLDGQEIIIQKDVTRVRDGHPLLKKYRSFFDLLKVHYDVERADSRPGEQRGETKPAPAPEPTPAPAPEPAPDPAPTPEPEAETAPKPTVGLRSNRTGR